VSASGYLGGAVGAPLIGTLWPSSSASTTVTAVGGGIIVVVLLAAVVFVAARILNSDIGLELFVLGVDERTAAALGVRTPRRKLELFVLGCVFAALGGAVYAGTQQFVPETVVDPTTELALLIMLFIGGRRSVIGAVIGALVIQYLQGASNWVSVNILIVEGVLLTNSPMWDLGLRYDTDVEVDGLRVFNNANDPTGAPNTDGIDLVGSTDVSLTHLDINTGDDNVAMKSGLPGIDPAKSLAEHKNLLLTGTEVVAKVRCGDHAMGYSLFYGVWEFIYEKVVFFF